MWKETKLVLKDLEAAYLGAPTPGQPLTPCNPSTSLAGFLLRPYELRVYWFEIVECVRKVALVGIPVFFVNDC